jgi:hypothetical protein
MGIPKTLAALIIIEDAYRTPSFPYTLGTNFDWISQTSKILLSRNNLDVFAAFILPNVLLFGINMILRNFDNQTLGFRSSNVSLFRITLGIESSRRISAGLGLSL